MTEPNRPPQRRAVVIGGSLGGLFAGAMLKHSGWQVDIYERSTHDLDSRGGGIVLQPDVVEVFRSVGVDVGGIDLGVRSRFRTVLERDGSIRSKELAPQTQTSWSLVYTTMKGTFGDEHYHQGKTLVDIRQDPSARAVTAIFEDGSAATGDLLVGADGGNSTVRQLLWPDRDPTYAGYIAWRGLIDEDAMPPLARQELHGDFGFANHNGSHILGYLVPGEGNDTREGHRIYNWVWYRVVDTSQLRDIMTDTDGRQRGFAMPEGKLAAKWRDHLEREAQELLPPAFREVVQATRHPFAQAIRDLTSERMVKDRAILLGDAAFIPRPHTAASTSKAAANALELAAALPAFPEDVDQALTRWEPDQLRLGNSLYKQGSRTGDFLLFQKPPAAKVG
ncbi:MAG: FAD binding domain-containing protein [Pseudomonadota bacterium]